MEHSAALVALTVVRSSPWHPHLNGHWSTNTVLNERKLHANGGARPGRNGSYSHSLRVVSMFTLCSSDSPAPILNHLLYA